MPWTVPTITPPPTLPANPTDSQYANYLAWVRINDERDRFERQAELTTESTAAQNARAVAEDRVAAAGEKQAAAALELARVAAAPIEPPATPPSPEITEATHLRALEIVAGVKPTA